MDTLSTDRLMKLAELKLHLLTQLRSLSFDQQQSVLSHNVDELLATLSRKNDVIDRLRTVQEELKPFQAQQAEDRDWASEEERQHCRELMARSDKLVAELLVMEDQALAELTVQRDFVGQQLHRFSNAEAINEAYRSASEHPDLDPETSLSLDG